MLRRGGVHIGAAEKADEKADESLAKDGDGLCEGVAQDGRGSLENENDDDPNGESNREGHDDVGERIDVNVSLCYVEQPW